MIKSHIDFSIFVVDSLVSHQHVTSMGSKWTYRDQQILANIREMPCALSDGAQKTIGEITFVFEPGPLPLVSIEEAKRTGTYSGRNVIRSAFSTNAHQTFHRRQFCWNIPRKVRLERLQDFKAR